MAVSQNRLLPVLGAIGLLVVGTIVYQQMRGHDAPVKAGSPMTSVPQPPPLPRTAKSGSAGADADSPSEALATVAASNRALRADVAKVLEENRRLVEEAHRNASRPGRRVSEVTDSAPGEVVAASSAPAAAAAPAAAQGSKAQVPAGTSAATPAPPSIATTTPRNGFEAALETAAVAAQQIRAALPANLGPSQPGQAAAPNRQRRSAELQGAARDGAALDDGAAAASQGAGAPNGTFGAHGRANGAFEGERAIAGTAPGAVSYVSRAPMGYAVVEDRASGGGRSGSQTRYVRTLASAQSAEGASLAGQGVAMAAAAAVQADSAKKEAVPYFTLPENSTLTGVRAMTSIIGRVPIDGRVTDPMQFKAMIGRDNLAANGWEMPQDLAGIIVSGIAIGDMALSCSEGKVRSLTFVFNDGTIRTVSARSRAVSMGGGGGGGAPLGGGDLGFLSDAHGNPCIAGKFVTNAPAYLGDIMGLRTVGLASQAFADAQRVVTQNAAGGQTTQISDANKYAMGQAVNGASEELSKWMMSRLKNSFDAVVTPAGAELNNLVVHLDQEVRLDKLPGGRRILHRMQEGAIAQRGGRYGLE